MVPQRSRRWVVLSKVALIIPQAESPSGLGPMKDVPSGVYPFPSISVISPARVRSRCSPRRVFLKQSLPTELEYLISLAPQTEFISLSSCM